ncbi:MAG: SDR family oxidoreductase [Bacteroidota bacterium]
MENLLRKNVLVIGAAGGIGKELVGLLKSSSANVFLTSTNLAKVQAVANQFGLAESQCFEMDVTSPNSIQAVADHIHGQVGQLDILINAAGIGILKPLEQLEHAEFNKTISINLTGSFNVLKAFLPPMKAVKKGLILHLPGVLGKAPMAGATAYAASKYGLNGMVKSLREELRRTNVRITNIYLGGVDTPFWDDIDMRVQRDKFITAKEAARSIWFLCQQPSSGVVAEMVIQPFNHQVI